MSVYLGERLSAGCTAAAALIPVDNRGASLHDTLRTRGGGDGIYPPPCDSIENW